MKLTVEGKRRVRSSVARETKTEAGAEGEAGFGS